LNLDNILNIFNFYFEKIGNEFRPDYLEFSKQLKELFLSAPIIAMTATANTKAIKEISL